MPEKLASMGTRASVESAFSRLEAVWGVARLSRIQAATVMVFGTGGVGSNCIEALVRGGVGTLVVIDGDAVAPSNINRQAIAYVDTIGQRKVAVVRSEAARINPRVRIISRDRFVRPEDVEPLIADCRAEASGHIDYIVDAIDTVSTKLAIARVAQEQSIPLVSSMGGAMKFQPERLRFADIYETAGDPLARVMRKECRKRGIAHLNVLFSDEPAHPLPADAPAGSSLGTTSYLPPIMGQMLAGFVLRKLADTICSAQTPRSAREAT